MLFGELAGLANAALWAGLSIVLGRLAGRLTAIRVNAFQLSFAALFYLLILPFAGGGHLFAGLTLTRLLALAGTAVLTMGVGDTLYFTGLHRIGASRASPISVSSFPLITLLLGAVLLGERLTWTILGGAVLIIGGIVLLVTQPASRSKEAPAAASESPAARAAKLSGILLVLGATVCWSAATLGLRVAAAGVPAVAVTAIRIPTAAVFLLIVLRSRGVLTFEGIGRRDWLTMIAAGAIGTGLGSLTYILAIQGTGAGLTALLTSTSPLWVLPMAALFLHERLTRRVLLGAVLALAGIWLVLV